MSIEEHLVQVIGICCILYWSMRTLLISGVKAYKEIRLNVYQCVREIEQEAMEYKIEHELNSMQVKR